MSKFGRVLLGFCVGIFLTVSIQSTTTEAPQVSLSQLRHQTEWKERDILLGIELLCKEYDFPYFDILVELARKESRVGQDTKCGDNGLSCGLFQYRKSTWEMLQKKYNRYDLNYENNIDQIEMTILALEDGYWYLWGPLLRKYKTNPFLKHPQ